MHQALLWEPQWSLLLLLWAASPHWCKSCLCWLHKHPEHHWCPHWRAGRSVVMTQNSLSTIGWCSSAAGDQHPQWRSRHPGWGHALRLRPGIHRLPIHSGACTRRSGPGWACPEQWAWNPRRDATPFEKGHPCAWGQHERRHSTFLRFSEWNYSGLSDRKALCESLQWIWAVRCCWGSGSYAWSA